MKALIPSKIVSSGESCIDWQDSELRGLLTKMVAQGLSASEIVASLHDYYVIRNEIPLTRNAILGAVHRYKINGGGLERRVKPAPRRVAKRGGKTRDELRAIAAGKARAERLAALKDEGRAKADALIENFGEIKPWEESAVAFQASHRPHKNQPMVSLCDMKSDQCRWPLECDDGSTMYCGAAVLDGSFSYCAAHSMIAYTGKPFFKPRNSEPQDLSKHNRARWYR